MKIKSVIYSLISIFVLFYFSCSDVAFETMIDFSLTKDDLQTYLARQGKDNALQENDEEITITATLYDEKDKEIAVVPQKFSLEEKEYRIQFEKIPVGQQVKAFISIVLNDCILAQLSSGYVTVKEGNTLIPLDWDAITTATYKIEHYQQNIETDEYSLIDTQYETGTIGTQTTAEAKTYAGFTTQEFSQQPIAMDNSTVVKFFYNRKVVNLTFDLAGGFLGETEGTFILSGKYGASVEVPTDPKRENFNFDGWDKTVPESFPANDETYTAKWRDINQVASVTFSIPAGNVSKNTPITLSCATEGATIYYRTSEKDVFFKYDSTANLAITEETTITAYAFCEGMIDSEKTSATYKLYQYTLAFETNAGSEIPDSISYSDGATVNLEFQTPREGYDFAGWYMSADYSGDSVTELTFSLEMEGLDKDSNTVTLYAKWTPVKYTITYELNAAEDTSGPENPNDITSYTIETETITLQNPTRNGYDFVGWYTDEDYTSQITQIEKGSTGDITLYAKWEEKYSFELGDQDDTPNEIDSGTAEYDSTTKTITVTNLDNSDSVWSYYIKSTNINFEKGKNYEISLELKSENRDTVVGIQAGNTDMFFTVGVDWTLCTLETGYIQQELSDAKNCITIGTGLSEKVSYRSLNITEITEKPENPLPALVFNVTKQGIENYLTQENKPSNIIEVEKNNGNTGYNITINTPLTSSCNKVSEEDGTSYYTNDVTLHLRGLSPATLGMAKASYTILNNDDLETSILIQPESNTMLAWNNAVKKVSDYNTDGNTNGRVFEYFPNYTTEEDIMVDVISKSSTVPSSNSTSFEIKEFKIESVTADEVHGKIFVMGLNDYWQQLSQDSQITMGLSSGDTSIDVLMLDSDLWNEKTGITSWDTVTRIKKLNIVDDFITSTINDVDITLHNADQNILTCNVSLTNEYVVEISKNEDSTGEESGGTGEETKADGSAENPFTTWDELAEYVRTSSDSEATVYITGDISVTSTISLANAVSLSSLVINPVGTVTISRNESMLYKFFDVQDGKSLSIVGTENEKITFSGGSIESDDSMFGINNASVSFAYCQFKDALSSDVAILRITDTENTTSVSIKNCTFEENTLYDVYIANCPSLILSGNVEIPKLYFKNGLAGNELTINVDEYLTGSVNIVLDKYKIEGNFNYDLDLFNLDDGASLPEGVFTLDDTNYVINSKGEINPIYSDWTTLADAITSSANTTSEFVLKGDITATSKITVSREITLKASDGVTITRGLNFKEEFFDNTSILTLEGITLDGGKNDNIEATAPLITSSKTLTLKNCTLQNNKNTSTTPGGAINISEGTFTMNGGVIGSEVTENDGTASWENAATDTSFSNYAAAGGGGIYVADGTVIINDAKISDNYTPNPGDDCKGYTPENTTHGGGISIENGSLSLINSEVSYNSGYQGGGIRCYNDDTSNAGTLTLNKTLIKGNTSNPYRGSSFGGGLMVKNFKVTFEETTESTIEQNYSGDGGALFLEYTNSTLKNITIQNNSYNSDGYHYGSEVLLWASANVSIASSDVTIKSADGETRGIFMNNNNTLDLSGGAKLDAPIYLTNGAMITVSAALTTNESPVATITPEQYNEETQVLTAENDVTLDVAKFALTPAADGTIYTIDSAGKLAKNTSTDTETGGGYSIGDIYYQNNTPMGVVFEVAEDNSYIKIVALEESDTVLKFDNGWLDTSDASYFSSENDGLENYRGLEEVIEFYAQNYDCDISGFPAADFCYNYCVLSFEDETWYLPAINELISIVQTNFEQINNAIQSVNGTEIVDDRGYWSSTMIEDTEKVYYCTNTTSGKQNQSKTTACNVRPIATITLSE